MMKCPLIVLVLHLCFSLFQCLIVQTHRTKDNQQICAEDRLRVRTDQFLRLCYVNQIRHRSVLVWFTTTTIVDDYVDHYRFLLRSIDQFSLSTNHLQVLTNFTELIDRNNSLRLLNLDAGQYEICLEFQWNTSWFIYQPRQGCISFRIGQPSHANLRQSSTELFLTLTMSISLFFVLGLIVQWRKSKRNQQERASTSSISDRESTRIPQRARAPSLLSTTSLKKQRDRIVRKLFRRHMDQSETSQMRQWARNHAFRHRISTQELDIERLTVPKHLYRSSSPYLTTIVEDQPSIATINDIYIIPITEISEKNVWDTNRTEEFIVI